MGVTGLWKLVEPCGKPVPVETLEGKILAIDISIWLHQVVKGFQDSKGNALPNAHLLGLFNRLCKLLYYRVKPVFVFDGGVPQLKRDTINKRHQQRGKLNSEADRIENLIVKALAQEKVVQQALGGNLDGLLKSPAKRLSKNSEESVDDLFKLPELPGIANSSIEGEQKDIESNTSYTTDDYDTEESSFEEKNTRYAYDSNLQAIDVRSKHFRDLPAELRHEILVDIKETRKHSWGRLHELPACSNQFSELQMKRLLKRRAVQESLEEVEEELGGKTITYSELINYFTEEGVLEKSAMENVAKPICSDENTRFVLVRNLKKIINAEADKSEVNYSTSTNKNTAVIRDEKAHTNKMEEHIDVDKPQTKTDECLGTEYDIDLQLALALSAEDSDVYRKEDYEYESDLQLRLNADQRRRLNKAAKGPARAYMIEYGGMNDDEVNGIMEETQLTHDTLDELQITKTDFVEDSKELKKPASVKEVVEVMDTDTDSDSDLEEVPLTVNADSKPVNSSLEIVLDLNKSLALQDDIFADVFNVENESTKNNQTNECDLADVQSKVEINDEAKVEKIEASSVHKDSSTNIASILDELKKQSNAATNINLDDIKVNNSIIELSDDDTPAVGNDEVITILSTPTKKDSFCTKLSPKVDTPSSKKITEYFETNYVIKRTPDKMIEAEVVPKVKSPFFIKKTPKSNRKESPSPSEKRTSKVSKALFDDSSDKNDTVVTQNKKSQDVEEAIETAVQVLKKNKSKEELTTLASDLAKERRQLESERNRQDRMGMTISERMSVDCQELLRLFGIPYIVAPMEAEAQCAFLDSNHLTDGTITDDSDIWLFGGRTVYKNFFATNKNVLEYNSDKIENLLKCDRIRLIQLACLVGSDYTNGVHGIGTVTALEILASFTSREISQTETNRSQTLSSVLTTLRRFRDWWQLHKTTAAPPGSSVRLALCKKLKNIELDDNFPSVSVIEAYLMPKVDDNREAFTWGNPDVESIREFARKKFGWTTVKTDETLQPVLKKLNEKKSQVSIKNYFAVKSVLLNKELKVSKRVQTAVNKLSGDAVDETEEQKEKPKKTRRGKRKQETTETKKTECAKVKKIDNTKKNNDIEDPNASRVHKLIHNREIIPQREKDRQQMENNKKLAADILKKASK